MKIFKKNEHSLLPRPILLQGRPHLSIAVLLFWDLTAPDSLLEEQELWKTVPQQLGPTPVLDQGMPKQVGEFLVVGDCCAPADQILEAGEVTVRVGELQKKLYVFGDRHWSPSGRSSKPQPFSRMPISWENAFGGPGFELNPKGKGMASRLEGDDVVTPLPNVEHPEHLVSSPDDRPQPAGLDAWDMTWPQRDGQKGTFDDRWKQERWPGLPDDFNYGFFNAAPTDQRFPGFLRGDEPVEIAGMHPQYQQLQSSLPGRRLRCFVTLRKNFKRYQAPGTFEQVFQEVSLHPETLWLFPTILRGLCLYRGVLPVADEDYGDVVRVFLATETLQEQPASLEHYREEQQKALDRGVPLDLAPLEAAKKKVAGAMRNLKNMPKEAARAKKAALGQMPVMPREPEELGMKLQGLLAGRMQTLEKLEGLAGGMNQRYGHIAPVDMKVFAKMRSRLQAIGEKGAKSVSKLSSAKEAGLGKKGALLQKNKLFLQKELTKEQLEKTGMDPDFPPGAKKSGDPWQERGFDFVVQSRRRLEGDGELLGRLERMGLERKTIRRAWLGLHPVSHHEDAAAWGLDEKQVPGGAFTIPAGLVLPRFEGRTLRQILLRPADAGADAAGGGYLLGAEEALVPGSQMPPLFLEAAVSSPQMPAPVVMVRDELQALYLEQEAGDFCHVLAMKTPKDKPEADAAAALEAEGPLLVVMPGAQATEQDPWQPWQNAFKKAKRLTLPKGRTLFEARAAGVDVRQTVLDALPKDYGHAHALEPELPPELEKGLPPKSGGGGTKLPFPQMNIGALVAGTMQEIKAAKQPLIAASRAQKGEAMARVAEQFSSQGLKPEESLAKATATPREPYSKTADTLADKLLAKRDELKAAGHLKPEKESEMVRQADRIKEIAARSEARAKRQKARFQEMKQKADSLKASAKSRKLPGAAGAQMEAAGLSPDALKPLTREEVIERHKAGLDFKRRNLTGVDCSKLDLQGIDLRKAILDKASFAESNLQGALLDGALARETDFGKTSLREAQMVGALFKGCKLGGANLGGANCRRVIFQKCDLSKADLSGARMRIVQAQDCDFSEADLADSDLSLSVFSTCTLVKAHLGGAALHKVVLRTCQCDDAVFAGASLPQTCFQGSSGERVSFEGCNLDKGRIISGSSFPGASFQKSSMRQAYFRESDLSDAMFNGARLDNACFEGCTMHRANLERISAKKARLTKCDLEGARMQALNLALGSLRMSRLVQADLSGANLFAVDFYKAVLGKTAFRLANLERTLLENRTELFS